MTIFMRRFGPAALTVLCLLTTQFTSAQTVVVMPRISHVTPMGARAGTTIELTVVGQDFGDVTGLHFSFEGATVEKLSSESVKELPKQPKKGAPAKGQIGQTFKITLPADVPLGTHDVRLVSKTGVSNPRAFVVGDLKEVIEQEPNDDLPKAQKVALNTTINGGISAGTDVDYYRFTGKKGQHVIVSCLTTSIDSKLPAMIELHAVAGGLLGSNRSYHHNDALVDAVLPADGDYYVRVASFTYTQGGPDYFYRLSISTTPWIDAVFPPIVEPGKETKVTVYGRNLPGGVPDSAAVHEGKVLEKLEVSVTAPEGERSALALRAEKTENSDFLGYRPPTTATIDGFAYRLKDDVGSSNGFMLSLAQAPVVLANGTNTAADNAQTVKVPCEIAGQINQKGERDWYAFRAKKGEVLRIDAFGERLGTQIDLFFTLQDAKGKVLTEQDENPEITANQFYTRNDDPPSYRFVVPADGDYKLMISSKFAFVATGPKQFYTVRIAPETPDFWLVAMPTAVLAPEGVTLNQASNQVYTVFVFRQGNFTGNITLTGVDLPEGVTIRPQLISGTQKQTNLVVSAAADAPAFTGAIKVIGTAEVGDRKLVRPMHAASITWPVTQAAPTISRLDRELVLAVREKAPYTLTVAKDEIRVIEGGKISIPIKAIRHSAEFKQTITVLAVNLPAGVAQAPLTLSAGSDEGVLVLTSGGKKGATMEPGIYNLAIRGQTLQLAAKGGQQPKGSEPGNYVQSCNPVTLTIAPLKK